MKVVIAGGSGSVGKILVVHFAKKGHEVAVLSRSPSPIEGARVVEWDGETQGAWSAEIVGTDVLVNLAGRSVNCRYNAANSKQMMSSRVKSTRALGEALRQGLVQPRVWLQASTATIYAHRYVPNDEFEGEIGGSEPNLPASWTLSYQVAKAWEAEFDRIETTARKVKLRTAMTMGVQPGSVFDVMAGLARRGLLGAYGDGQQYVSWIHEYDFAQAIDFLIEHDELIDEVNVCSPHPLPNREFNQILRQSLGVRFGLDIPQWQLEIGARFLRTETELVLKSRCVVPRKLLESGFEFRFPHWLDSAKDLAQRLPRVSRRRGA